MASPPAGSGRDAVDEVGERAAVIGGSLGLALPDRSGARAALDALARPRR